MISVEHRLGFHDGLAEKHTFDFDPARLHLQALPASQGAP